MDPADFEECMRKARRGDRPALDLALGEIRGGLRDAASRGLRGKLRSRMETSDILQTTYLDIVRGIEQFRGADPDSFAAWVGRILDHNIVDKLKFHGRDKRRPADRQLAEDVIDDVPAAGRTPSLELIQLEELQMVGQALKQLDEAQRRAIVLRLIKQLDYATIAKELDRSEGAVRMLVVRAQAALALRLDQILNKD